MTRSQELRRHLIDEHDVSELTVRLAGFGALHALHAAAHDHRGSIFHTSHKGLDVESRATRDVSWRVVIECQSKRHAEEVAKHVQHVRPGDVDMGLISVSVRADESDDESEDPWVTIP